MPAFAQAKPVVGFLSSRSPDESRHLVAAFQKGLSETGFSEPGNLSVEYRWANGHYDQLPAMAKELVGLGAAAIFTAGGPPSAVGGKSRDHGDPDRVLGSQRPRSAWPCDEPRPHPDGNVTGMSTLTTGIATKSI